MLAAVFELRREPLSEDEREGLHRQGRLLFRSNRFPRAVLDTMQADVLVCSVRQAWIPAEASEEIPIYVLDTGERVLCLAGQWLYDPHTTVCSEELSDRWKMEQEFFRSIELRAILAEGIVLRLRPLEAEFLPVQKLAPVKWKQLRECELASASADGVLDALRGAQLIED